MRVKDLCDDKKLRERYRHKQQNCKRQNRGIEFLLTFEEYCGLMRDAGIKSSDLGRKGFHLARYGDVGNYILGNCRFVPYLENFAERKPPPPGRISAAMRAYYENHPGSFTGRKHAEDSKVRIGVANSVHQSGSGNSQFGRPRSEETKRKIAESMRRFHAAVV